MQVGLLFAVLATGLIISGCQKPAPAPVADRENVTGTIKIEEANDTAKVNGSITIEAPKEQEVNGAVTIMPATDVVVTDTALDTATKAMENGAVTVK